MSTVSQVPQQPNPNRKLLIIHISLFILIALATFSLLIFQNYQLQEKIKNITYPKATFAPSAPAPIPQTQEADEIQLEQNIVVHGGIFIPRIGESLDRSWIAYTNWDYGFTFLFPSAWQVDVSDDHMAINRLICLRCAGGVFGIQLKYHKNEQNQPIDQFIFGLNQHLQPNKPTVFETENKEVVAYVDRQTPGAGPGQTAFIAKKDGISLIELYCGDCTDEELNNIVKSFYFDAEKYQ